MPGFPLKGESAVARKFQRKQRDIFERLPGSGIWFPLREYCRRGEIAMKRFGIPCVLCILPGLSTGTRAGKEKRLPAAAFLMPL
jgi:hypothetical protein